MRRLLFCVVLESVSACGSSTFTDAPGRTQPVQSSDSRGSSRNRADTDDIFGGNGSASLPTDCRTQNVLILDFKSGWWEGDGGDTFRNLILDEIRLHACPGANAGVEYHHIIAPDIPETFHDADFATYTQVWVLSGSLADPADIPLTTPGFLDVLSKIEAHKPRLFLGAGFGSVDHVNEVADLIWGTPAFHADYKTGEILLVGRGGANVEVRTYITPNVSGNLFEGTDGPLVDHVKVGGTYAGTDELLALPGMSILADCTTAPIIPGDDIFRSPQEVPSRVVGCIGIGAANGFRVVADGGLQRFYGMYGTEEATKVYLRNIFRALSL